MLYRVKASELTERTYEIFVEAANEDAAHDMVANHPQTLAWMPGSSQVGEVVVIDGAVREIHPVEPAAA